LPGSNFPGLTTSIEYQYISTLVKQKFPDFD
jgi:hypothetical protein